MGAGTIMQLVSYGSQDIYITGNPQITNFKFVYNRHTNFIIQNIEELFLNDIKLIPGNSNSTINSNTYKITSIIPKKPDLLYKVYLNLEIEHPKSNSINTVPLVQRPGHAIIHCIELEIGGQIVDKLYGQWLDIWTQLSYTSELYQKYNYMINSSLSSKNYYKYFINLPFWFTKNPGLSLPIIALNKHDIKIHITFNVDTSFIKYPVNELDRTQKAINIKASLLCDYIFLDKEEQRIFSQLCHEYLIENVQRSDLFVASKTETSVNLRLKFNHPVKEIIWICQDSKYTSPGTIDYSPFAFNRYSNTNSNILNGDLVKSAKLLFNNNYRFKSRESSYFRIVQPYQHHSGGFDNQLNSFKEKGFIYCYSFAINPEENQPSGTCNFSRIDDPILILNLNNSIGDNKYIRVYAINYNVFKVFDGMGGLVFS
tara:strand:- start:994 stop:2274 length:1281 start_codon:yes stop_codon:yes gene_type:complete